MQSFKLFARFIPFHICVFVIAAFSTQAASVEPHTITFDEYEIELQSDLFVYITFRRFGYYTPTSRTGHPDNWEPPEGDDEAELIYLYLYNAGTQKKYEVDDNTQEFIFAALYEHIMEINVDSTWR